MRPSRVSLVALLTVGILTVAACSSDRSYAPPGTVLTDARISADVAAIAAATVANDLEDQASYVTDAGISASRLVPVHGAAPQPTRDGAPPGNAGAGASNGGAHHNCSYVSASGRWECQPYVNTRGLTVVRSYAYYDASGAPMQVYDRATTARINYQVSENGTLKDDGTFTGSIHHSSSKTASGLLGNETRRTWDGVGMSVDTTLHHDSTSTRRYAGARVDSTRALTYAVPRQQGAYPLAGQTVVVANYTVTSTGRSTETRSVSRRVVITYNGTATARVESGTVVCTLHLDTHEVDGCQPR